MGQEEGASPLAAVAFSWEHDQVVQALQAPGMPGSPTKAPATVFLSWEHDPAATKPVSTPAVKPRGVPESARKAPARRLSVPPPPGRPAARGVSRAVRPEDDPFLAAYLACTKSTGRSGGDSGKKATSGPREREKGQRRIAWGLGALSCKRDDRAVVQSMVRVAKLPEVDPRDA